MAIDETSTAIVPVGTGFSISVKDFDAAGAVTSLSCSLPDSTAFERWSLVQQVVMLKRGLWKDCAVPDILWGLAYAQRLGADVMKGELYPTGGGRWGTSNKFKIKQALATGRVHSIEVTIVELNNPINLTGCSLKKDLECTVTLEVEGFTKPIIRRAKLSSWFNAKNPNWVGRPEHMLELNTVAHACEYIEPGGTEPDEAPPLELPVVQSNKKENE